jgi:hypothetical protein
MFHQYEGDDATEAGSVTDRGTDGERTEATNEREEEGEEEEEEGLGQLIQEHSTVSLVSNSKSTATQGKQATAQPSWCWQADGPSLAFLTSKGATYSEGAPHS